MSRNARAWQRCGITRAPVGMCQTVQDALMRDFHVADGAAGGSGDIRNRLGKDQPLCHPPARLPGAAQHQDWSSQTPGISIQGQSAMDAWKEVSRLAEKYSIPVDVRLKWRENEKAQHPGKVGVIRAG
jgi:hypothetical protein